MTGVVALNIKHNNGNFSRWMSEIVSSENIP
jgi:hypothetical protein